MKQLLRNTIICFVVCILFMVVSPLVFHATDESLDSVQEEEDSGRGSGNDAVSDYLKSYEPVTEENMAKANQFASPIVNVIGNAIGFILIIVSAGIMFVTALDLCYIGLPFTRSFLNPMQNQQQGGGMGGMGMGGMGGYGMRGMGGMGGMGGTQQPQGGGFFHRQWVSDEAIQCAPMAQAPQGGGMGGMGMGGMGMGMGGMGMGGMGMGAQQPQQSTKSCVFAYFKKRVFFIIIFTISTIMLTSSIFTDTGINIAAWLFTIMDKVNTSIGNAAH